MGSKEREKVGDNSAFPTPKINDGRGLSAREYAAIHLRVPESGIQWLDDMIIESIKIIKTN